jgi:hypothetical protein
VSTALGKEGNPPDRCETSIRLPRSGITEASESSKTRAVDRTAADLAQRTRAETSLRLAKATSTNRCPNDQQVDSLSLTMALRLRRGNLPDGAQDQPTMEIPIATSSLEFGPSVPKPRHSPSSFLKHRSAVLCDLHRGPNRPHCRPHFSATPRNQTDKRQHGFLRNMGNSRPVQHHTTIGQFLLIPRCRDRDPGGPPKP